MATEQDIILAVDYHVKNMQVRWLDLQTGEERLLEVPTARPAIMRLLEQALTEAAGRVRWIMESTTGWARIQELIGRRADFILANVLQMPRAPNARRRKSDRLDTGRMLREELAGTLPRAFQPGRAWREARRLVDARQDLVRRRTQLKNWISSYLHHETWEQRSGLWSQPGRARLGGLKLSPSDRCVMDLKLGQLQQVEACIQQAEAHLGELYRQWPMARWVDEVRGVGMVTAVSLLARIGPVERFASAEALIALAGLAPGYHQSSDRRRDGHLGGGGTDGYLRFLVIEASTWLRQVPRYRATYQRVLRKRGKNIARIVLARLFLRSLYKMLRDKVRFNQAPALSRDAARMGRPRGAGATSQAGKRRRPEVLAPPHKDAADDAADYPPHAEAVPAVSPPAPGRHRPASGPGAKQQRS